MAQIVINEISKDYSYNIGTNSFATVAMPLTACWGPGFVDPGATGESAEDILEKTVWQRFPATQAGLEAFVATYRGPSSNYRLAKDFSYYEALTLLTNGYDILACRLAPGIEAENYLAEGSSAAVVPTVENIYNLLTAAPADWGTNYASYYTRSGEGTAEDPYVYASVEPAFDLLTSEPEDWATNYTSYYTRSSEEPYVYSHVTGETAPTFAADTYYEAVAPEFAANTYFEKDSRIYTHFVKPTEGNYLHISAKYPGTFGNNISVELGKVVNRNYWSLIIYVTDSSGSKAAVENLQFVLDADHASDAIPYIEEVKSNFVNIEIIGTLDDSAEFASKCNLMYGADTGDADQTVAEILASAKTLDDARFGEYYASSALANIQYKKTLDDITTDDMSFNAISCLRFNQWKYRFALYVYDLLKDRLAYNPQRIVSPWDDQDFFELGETSSCPVADFVISPIHKKLMDVAYRSRCATSLIDIPRSLLRSGVWNESTDAGVEGYAQMLGRDEPQDATGEDIYLYATHSALFAPWGSYKYSGTSKRNTATPSFLALMIQRAMILNQPIQYEWALPTNRRHNLNIGELDYTVSTKYLDTWQGPSGVNVNVISPIPGLGVNLWGDSTLFEIPPATYQALENLSTRYLYNAIKDQAFKCGLAITFQYNNGEAYDAFYCGVSPLLDTMINVGAIDDYLIEMGADIDGLASVNANSVIGKIYVTIHGVIKSITIDLIALPAGTDLTQFSS